MGINGDETITNIELALDGDITSLTELNDDYSADMQINPTNQC
jgi:hypothetical protein